MNNASLQNYHHGLHSSMQIWSNVKMESPRELPGEKLARLLIKQWRENDGRRATEQDKMAEIIRDGVETLFRKDAKDMLCNSQQQARRHLPKEYRPLHL